MMTQKEVAEALGISRARVDQIERKALRKLRNSGKLDAFRELLYKSDMEEYYGEKYQPIRPAE